MAYIKLMKKDGDFDLLPADNIVHVSAPSGTNADIAVTYGVTVVGAASETFLIAIIAGGDKDGTDAALTPASRNGINAAIVKAITEPKGSTAVAAVDLGEGLFCKSVTIGDEEPT
jgi:hypothetical protein